MTSDSERRKQDGLVDQIDWQAVQYCMDRSRERDPTWSGLWAIVAKGLADNVGSRGIVKRAVECGYGRNDAEIAVGYLISEANSMVTLQSFRNAAALGIRIKKFGLRLATLATRVK